MSGDLRSQSHKAQLSHDSSPQSPEYHDQEATQIGAQAQHDKGLSSRTPDIRGHEKTHHSPALAATAATAAAATVVAGGAATAIAANAAAATSRSLDNTTPTANEGRARAKDMTDVYVSPT